LCTTLQCTSTWAKISKQLHGDAGDVDKLLFVHEIEQNVIKYDPEIFYNMDEESVSSTMRRCLFGRGVEI